MRNKSEAIAWQRFPHGCYSASLRRTGRIVCRMTVEILHRDAWEWLAWSADRPSFCFHGVMGSLAEARRAAEFAAQSLAYGPQDGSVPTLAEDGHSGVPVLEATWSV